MSATNETNSGMVFLQNPVDLKTFEDLLKHERFKDAALWLEQALEVVEDPQLHWRLALRQAQMRRGDDAPLDMLIMAAEALLASEETCQEDLPRMYGLIIQSFSRKRCFALAEAWSERALLAVGEAKQVLVAQGDLALAQDARDQAGLLYQRAQQLEDPPGQAHYAAANLCYVLADFDGCAELLAQIPPMSGAYARALRLQSVLCAANDDPQGEARAWLAVLDLLPDGDERQGDRVRYALALAAAGDRPLALDQFRQAWRQDPETGEGRFARDRLEYLESAAPDVQQRRLVAFPSTTQKHEYCGPAVLELCLRYLDFALTQDEIAEAVKREHGTPMHEIAAYLDGCGIAARRVEATPERIRAAIDLGLPVIVQEEYSNTSHVAVIIGYDQALGMFLVADPATHRPLLKSFEWTSSAGSLFGNGGVIVVGRRGPALEPLERALDEAGLLEARHLVLVDECDRLQRMPGSGGQSLAQERVIALCSEAVALSPGFRLAWHRRWQATYALELGGRAGVEGDVERQLYDIRTRFAGDEFPHQLQARRWYSQSRFAEAFLAWFEASRRDPGDADNLQAMGDCQWMLGDLPQAETHLLHALALQPDHIGAAICLTGVYQRELVRRDDEQKEDDPQYGAEDDPLAYAVVRWPAEVETALDLDLADLVCRAEHFCRVARCQAPDNAFVLQAEAALCVRRGDLAAAEAAWRRALEINAGRMAAVLGLAGVREQLGAVQEADELFSQALERFWSAEDVYMARAGFLGRQERQDEAAETLLQGLCTLNGDRWDLAWGAFDLLAKTSSREAAAARLRELTESRHADEALLRTVANQLDRRQQRGHAIALLRQVIQRAPNDINSCYRLGRFLCQSLVTRDEGRMFLERAMHLAPEHPLPRRALAWALLPLDPQRGLELLEPVLDREDPWVLDAQAALYEALGLEEEAQEAQSLALGAFDSHVAGLVQLADHHLDEYRYSRALHLARQIWDHEMPPDLLEEAQQTWVQAHRMSGDLHQATERLNLWCAGGVPTHLAWETYWTCRNHAYDLAAKAALVYSAQLRDAERRFIWRIHAAGPLGMLGDFSLLEEVRGQCGESAEAWAELCWSLEKLDRFEEAAAAAKQAYALDPTDKDALVAMEETCARQNDIEGALGCAWQLLERYPYEHQGPERLGILLGKLGRVEEALQYGERALDAAPYCHISWRSYAVALFAAGRLEEARVHAVQSMAMDVPEKPDQGLDELMIRRAVDGDLAGVLRCLEDLAVSEPPEVFADFKRLLVEVARSRGEGASAASLEFRYGANAHVKANGYMLTRQD